MSQVKQPRLHPRWIDSHAYGIVKALQKKDFETYLVGGCVRDLLLGIIPKDFDIATTAHPDEVKGIIYKSYVIGKRFRLVLVKREEQQFEVATFRKDLKTFEGSDEDLPTGDNLFGTAEEDANRRDFTINALFYDPIKNELLDYPGGLTDLKSGWIRMIGDPTERLIEDPIRILRALRLAHKIGFSIEPSLKAAMKQQSLTLATAALPRKREEFLKLLRLSDPALAFMEAFDLDILKFASPTRATVFENDTSSEIFLRYLQGTHDKVLDKSSPVELFGVLILAYLRAKLMGDPSQPLKAKDLHFNNPLLTLMKDELGIFKYEQSQIIKAIQLQ
ncbi:MAG: poly(A) polymerase, partial [Bdellovibrionales bacterium]|nr:poly(A) polymerase [Bdellovibrionales bacterium]